MQRNIARLQVVLLAGFAVVALTLGYWQFFRQDEILARGTNPRIAEEARRVVRGRILDRTGAVLAENVPNDDGGSERRYPTAGLAAVVESPSATLDDQVLRRRWRRRFSG